MRRASPTSRARRRRRRRCGRSPAISRSCCSPRASSAPGCWRCRCSRGPPPTPSRRAFAGRIGLGLPLAEARGFYFILTVATLLGVAIDLSGVDSIKMLLWAAIVNGVISVPIMAVMMLLAAKPAVMGRFRRQPAPEGAGLARDRRHGRGGHRHVRRHVADWRRGTPYAAAAAAAAGNQSANVVVPPGSLVTLTEPPCSCMIVLTIASPRPAPSEDFSRAGSTR